MNIFTVTNVSQAINQEPDSIVGKQKARDIHNIEWSQQQCQN